MQLEPLLTSLGIAEFIPQLSEFRDNILREKAAELQTLAKDHADTITALEQSHADKIAEISATLSATQADLAAKNALIDSAKLGIKGAIANADLDDTATVQTIAHIVALAEIPTIEKRKAEIAAEIAAKQSELQSLYTPEQP